MSETINMKALADPILDSQFEQLCVQNQETKFELTSHGELIVISPRSESGSI